MKRALRQILKIGFFLILIVNIYQATIECHGAGVVQNDPFVKNFVQKLNNPLVKFQKDEVLFFADPSIFSMGTKFFSALCMGGIAVGALVVSNKPEEKEKIMLKSISIFPALLSLFLAFSVGSDIYNKLGKDPYVILSNKGFICGESQFESISFGHTLILWDEIETVKIIKIDANSVAEFKDKNKTTMATVASGIGGLLPVSMNSFLELFEYYWEKNIAG